MDYLDVPFIEEKLGVSRQCETLSESFSAWNSRPAHDTERFLREFKGFLGREYGLSRKIFQGTVLDSTDCLTLAVMAVSTGHRQGFSLGIARPSELSHYFHAMLVYSDGVSDNIFKLTGKSKPGRYTPLDESDIVFRLKFTTPLVRTVNRVKSYFSS